MLWSFVFWENCDGYDGGVVYICFVVLESFLCGFYGLLCVVFLCGDRFYVHLCFEVSRGFTSRVHAEDWPSDTVMSFQEIV